MSDKSEKVIALIQPEPNKDMVAELEALLEQAERGDFVGAVIVKRTTDGRFGTRTVGVWSDLEKVGALTFAAFDVMQGNKSVPEQDS